MKCDIFKSVVMLQIVSVARCDRRENILSVLTNYRKRFKCGREIKKRTNIWGLRLRLPPPMPNVNLSFGGPVTEEALRELWQGHRRLQFLTSSNVRGIPDDNRMRGIMMGVAYLQSSGNPSETDSPCPSPVEEETPPPPPPPVTVATRPQVATLYGAGAVKKTVKKQHKPGLRRRNTNDGFDSAMPPTPPTSVSAPATPPAGEKVLAEAPDTSGDDETSSKSTLDLIIPPLKDFEGTNNPFLSLFGCGNATKRTKDVAGITLPLPLTAVIPGKPLMRPTKRQLSEKDIFIGPNGEVKRRRYRRNAARNFTQTASKTATVVPTRPREWDSGEYYLNGRRLRQRVDKNEKEKAATPPPQPQRPQPTNQSPVKQEPDINMDDLKSSVNMYFGAANRIATGEKFTVKAQRVGPNGKMEFLIEWEGLT